MIVEQIVIKDQEKKILRQAIGKTAINIVSDEKSSFFPDIAESVWEINIIFTIRIYQSSVKIWSQCLKMVVSSNYQKSMMFRYTANTLRHDQSSCAWSFNSDESCSI